ncbi:hypothetical protein GCM10009788_44010 [Nocardioides humi]|uniref:Addiction module component n=1 Tax=Nocardioides humi TaxID=449461 RepID=A0ABN2BAV1_9ACTN
MVDPVLLEQVVRLSADDRRELFEAAQDALDPALADQIDERQAVAVAEPGAGRTWEHFRAELREQHGR